MATPAMFETIEDSEHSRFDNGSEVRVVRDVRNDGSFYGLEKGELLVAEGAVGMVRSFGWFLQDQIIYEVFFPHNGRQIGLRDVEVIDAALPWQPCRFRSLDIAQLALSLRIEGAVVAHKGALVQVQWPHRDLDSGTLSYDILLANDIEVTVPDRALLEPDTTVEDLRWRRKSSAI
ncbi:nitrogen fixation protein NifZ [Shewanella sp. A32]|uniref:nitrogen fixation protein NifZ n=1 Tax=Shewanella sp. A32 TaxID=3031327 RepID=UPI0023B9D6CE|nr:nitrogen fixation protein NifZ [Shewanella sp. A32]MDF0535871.1 nitrogen fixation protein NifZ [Shewanella sp. A32]